MPELNREGPVSRIGITSDGLIIYAAVPKGGRRQVVLDIRPHGFVDPLPEVNDTAEARYL